MMSCVAATKSAPSKKNTADTPPNVNSSQTAERTMFCDTCSATALRPVKAAMIQKRMACWSIVSVFYLETKEESGAGAAGQAPGINWVGVASLTFVSFHAVYSTSATDAAARTYLT